MKSLVFLAHRCPYPPNKGDKIRSFNLLRYLSGEHKVYLGTFIDEASDLKYVSELKAYCADTYIGRLSPKRAKLASARGLWTGESLTVPYYRDRNLKQWLDETVRQHQPSLLYAFSSGMAQYLEPWSGSNAATVMDFVDVDSEKWRRYGTGKPWPLSWLYRREADRLLEYERKIAGTVDLSVFVSAAEAGLFRRLAPEYSKKISSMANGVDYAYFSPEHSYENPYQRLQQVLVFTGAMDYWPNIDAVQWFAKDILPGIQNKVDGAAFYIVGMNPSREVKQLAARPGVVVTGGVPDVRPYVFHATAAVAPLRIARGIQNKVLEAMALEKPVVATDAAIEGICAEVGRHFVRGNDVETFRAGVVRVLKGAVETKMGKEARALVMNKYDWDRNIEGLVTEISQITAGKEKAAG